MLAVETNVLVYAHRRETAEHDAAAAVLRGLAEGSERWSIPWPCVYEFASVVTNRRIWKAAASTPAQAWAQLRAWHSSPTCSLIGETEGFFDLLQDYLVRPRVQGPVVHDARIAAICVAHGVEALLTRDRDFTLYPELPTRNPFGRLPRATSGVPR
jgi:uncharacterized protein